MKLLKEYEALFETFSDQKKKLADENQFIYIYTKAYTFLKQGYNIYIKNDFFGKQFLSWDESDIETIKLGCKHILEGKGLTADNPFVGLGVFGFTNLFRLLHFESVGRKSTRVKNQEKVLFLDQINFEHIMYEYRVQYYNLVEH